MKIIGIVPARKGSVRIKNKNLINFCGKPLILWTINQTLKINLINEVYLSSDSLKILNLCKKISSRMIFNKRPKILSGNKVKSETVIKYLIKKYNIDKNSTILLLQPTSPLRSDRDIINMIKIFKLNKLKTLHSASIYQGKLKISGNKKIFSLKKSIRCDRAIYSYNGAIYMFKVDYFLKKNTIYEYKPNIYLTKKKNSLDIDTYSDLKKY